MSLKKNTIELFFSKKKNHIIIIFLLKKITLLNKLKSITSAQCTSYAFKVSIFCWIQILENFCESFDLLFFYFLSFKVSNFGLN